MTWLSRGHLCFCKNPSTMLLCKEANTLTSSPARQVELLLWPASLRGADVCWCLLKEGSPTTWYLGECCTQRDA